MAEVQLGNRGITILAAILALNTSQRAAFIALLETELNIPTGSLNIDDIITGLEAKTGSARLAVSAVDGAEVAFGLRRTIASGNTVLAAADLGGVVRFTGTSQALTLPLNSVTPIPGGSRFFLFSTNKLNVTAPTGATLNGVAADTVPVGSAPGISMLWNTAPDTWHIVHYAHDIPYNVLAVTSGTTVNMNNVTSLDFTHASGTTVTALQNGVPGTIVVALFNNGNTTFTHSSSLRMKGAVNYTPIANSISLFECTSPNNWREIARMGATEAAISDIIGLTAALAALEPISNFVNVTAASTTLASADNRKRWRFTNATPVLNIAANATTTLPDGMRFDIISSNPITLVPATGVTIGTTINTNFVIPANRIARVWRLDVNVFHVDVRDSIQQSEVVGLIDTLAAKLNVADLPTRLATACGLVTIPTDEDFSPGPFAPIFYLNELGVVVMQSRPYVNVATATALDVVAGTAAGLVNEGVATYDWLRKIQNLPQDIGSGAIRYVWPSTSTPNVTSQSRTEIVNETIAFSIEEVSVEQNEEIFLANSSHRLDFELDNTRLGLDATLPLPSANATVTGNMNLSWAPGFSDPIIAAGTKLRMSARVYGNHAVLDQQVIQRVPRVVAHTAGTAGGQTTIGNNTTNILRPDDIVVIAVSSSAGSIVPNLPAGIGWQLPIVNSSTLGVRGVRLAWIKLTKAMIVNGQFVTGVFSGASNRTTAVAIRNAYSIGVTATASAAAATSYPIAGLTGIINPARILLFIVGSVTTPATPATYTSILTSGLSRFWLKDDLVAGSTFTGFNVAGSAQDTISFTIEVK